MWKNMDFCLLLKTWVQMQLKLIAKNLSNKHRHKLLDSAKKSTMDAIKTASKRTIQKTVEETGDLIVNKIADKITSVSTELHSQNNDVNNKKEIAKERLIKENKLLMN